MEIFLLLSGRTYILIITHLDQDLKNKKINAYILLRATLGDSGNSGMLIAFVLILISVHLAVTEKRKIYQYFLRKNAIKLCTDE